MAENGGHSGTAVQNGVEVDPADAAVRAVLGKDRYEVVHNSKLLVVGAGGIGCELLKNLVLTGFRDIEVVDLDTIDVSNLNRQFLFRRKHVDRPKAEVAAEAVREFRPGVKIIAHHGNVKEPQYGVEFISKFDVVVNALDNLDARRHVNRLCLAAERPLLEAGSTGHLGQVTVIRKGETECFECQAKPTQKVYPYCTIRSTPEKPVHCLTWAKNLFDLCFGPEDESNLLSDLAADMRRFQSQEQVDGAEVGRTIFAHLFHDDIEKQAKLEDLWSEKRPPPAPLAFDRALERAAGAGSAMEGAAGGSEEATLAPDASNAEDLSFEGPLAELQRALLVLSGAAEHRVSEGEAAQEETEATNFDEPIANLQLALSRLGQPSQEQEERSLEAFETEIENLQQAISWLSSKREDSFEQPALAEAQELDAFAGPMAELQEALAKLGAVEGAPHTESEAGVATPATAPLAIAETPSGGAWLGEQGGGGPPEALFKAAAEGELDLGGPRELPEATTAFLSAFGSLGPAQALIRQKYARSDFRGRM